MSGQEPLPTVVGALLLRAAKRGSLLLVRAILTHPLCDLMARDKEGNTALHIAASRGYCDIVEELATKCKPFISNSDSVVHDKGALKCTMLIKCSNCCGNTPLLVASKEGKYEVVDLLVSKYKAELSACNNADNTCLHLAALYGHTAVFELLVKKYGCSPSVKGCKNMTPLHYASAEGHIELVDKIMNEYKCELSSNRHGYTPLHSAALRGNCEVVKKLITKHNSLIYCRDNEGKTPLLCAASRGHTEIMLTLCSTYGASILTHDYINTDNNGNGAIHLAAINGHIGFIYILIEKFSVRPDIKGYDNRTPLHHACSNGHVNVVKLLIEKYNCNIMTTNRHGLTALHLASGCGRLDIVRLLVDKYKHPVNCVDKSGNTPLHSACSSGSNDVVTVLIRQYGAKPDSCNNNMDTPVHISALNGNVTVFNTLVDTFARNPKARGSESRTPLHYAVGRGHTEMVEKLFTEYNCDCLARDKHGITPIQIAVALKFQGILNLFLSCQSVTEIIVHGDTSSMINTPEKSNTCSSNGDFTSDPFKSIALYMMLQACEADNMDVIDELISEGLCKPVDHFTEDCITLLHIASTFGSDNVVRLLINDYSHPVDCVDIYGNTPLIHATTAGHINTVKVLVTEFGASLTAKNDKNLSALHIAVCEGHDQLIRILIDELDCSLKTRGGEYDATLLHYACEYGQANIVMQLIDRYNCDPMERDAEEYTPLHIAACTGNLDVVKIIISKYNCSVECINKYGDTPLLSAVNEGHAVSVKLLLSELNANKEAKNKNMHTAVHIAAMKGKTDIFDMLIEEFNCDPNSRDFLNRIPLHSACEWGNICIAKKLIDKHGADIMTQDINGMNPLHVAACNGQEEIIKQLVTEYRYSIDIPDKHQYTPLMHAVKKGHSSTVRALLSELKADASITDSNNQTVLHIAVYEGHTDIVRMLVEIFGCNPSVKDFRNQTVLHLACTKCGLDLVKMLIEKYKCDPMARNSEGQTPLHYAARFGIKDVVHQLVINYHCPIECTDLRGYTPLLLASECGEFRTVKKLVFLGADVEAMASNQQSSLYLAARNGHDEVLSVLIDDFGLQADYKDSTEKTLLHISCQRGHLTTAQMLIKQYKCDPMARDTLDFTPLHFAATFGRTDIIRMLVTDHGCLVNCTDNEGHTALMLAANRGHLDAVKLLISELGANIEAKNEEKDTAIHIAACEGQSDIIATLVELGGNPEIGGRGNKTPLHYACFSGHLETVKKLITDLHCDPMAEDDNGTVPLHMAAQNGMTNVVKYLVTVHGCSVQSLDKGGNTPTHLATSYGHPDTVELLSEIFGAFPSTRNKLGDSPMDYLRFRNERFIHPRAYPCSMYLHKHGIQQLRKSPIKVIVLGCNNEVIVDLINKRSVYCLPKSHTRTITLNYINESLKDIWIYKHPKNHAEKYEFVKTFLAYHSFSVMCVVDLDTSVELAIESIQSQLCFIMDMDRDTNDKGHKYIVICGVSKKQELSNLVLNAVVEKAVVMLYDVPHMRLIDSSSVCISTDDNSFENVASLLNSLVELSTFRLPNIHYGSMYLLKLPLHEFSDRKYISSDDFERTLQMYKITNEGPFVNDFFRRIGKARRGERITIKDFSPNLISEMFIFLKELDQLGYIIKLGDVKSDRTIIFLSTLTTLYTLIDECSISSDPLVRMGIVKEGTLSKILSEDQEVVRLLLAKFNLPCIKFPSHVIAPIPKGTPNTVFFMPHLISEPRTKREWYTSCANCFSVCVLFQLSNTNVLPKKVQYAILAEIVEYFIAHDTNEGDSEKCLCKAMWKSGFHWIVNGVETLLDIFENEKTIAIFVRSSAASQSNTLKLLAKLEAIITKIKVQHCNNALHTFFVINTDALKGNVIPCATTLPKMEVQDIHQALSKKVEYLNDNEGTRVNTASLQWFKTFTLRGQLQTVEKSTIHDIVKWGRVSNQWKEIGRELGIPEAILQEYSDSDLTPEICWDRVVQDWLMYRGGVPSWYCLRMALQKVNMTHLADKIIMKWGPHDAVEDALQDKQRKDQTISDRFLLAFAEIVKSDWTLIAPHFFPNYLLKKKNSQDVIKQLREWKEEKKPSYRMLSRWLNQVIFKPFEHNGEEMIEDIRFLFHNEGDDEDLHIFSEEEDFDSDNEDMGYYIDIKKQMRMLDDALEDGHIKTGLDVVLFIGAAGSGKSHYKNLCLGLPPPEVRDSTGLSEHPVRTMSFVRGAMKYFPQNIKNSDYHSVQWKEVSPEDFLEMITQAIVEGKLNIGKPKDSLLKIPINCPAERYEISECAPDSDLDEATTTARLDLQKDSSKATASMEAHCQAEKETEYLLLHQSEMSSDVTYKTKLYEAMLPILVQTATACVLTVQLNKPLNKVNEVEFVQKGKRICKPYLSILTNQQVAKYSSQIISSQTENCKLFVVGTHRDLEHECEMESRHDKNKKLLELLKPQLGTNLEVYLTGSGDLEQLIYPVNSKTPKKEDHQVVNQFRNAVSNICRSKEKIHVPLYWFLLELLLHKIAATCYGVLSFDGCKAEALQQLKLSHETFPIAVDFLAKKLGTVMYFPQVLPKVIFTPQALMSVLSEIVRFRHSLKDGQSLPDECRGKTGEWLEFQNYGIISKSLFTHTHPFKHLFSEMFTPNDFFLLMMKLLIVAKIKEGAFFLPSVLEEIPQETIDNFVESCSILRPLVFCCSNSVTRGYPKENWLPVGSFTSLIAHLQNNSKWIIHTDKFYNPVCLYRNCVQFTLPDNQPGVVTLVDQFRHIEVFLNVNHTEVKKVSSYVCLALYSGLKDVYKCLHRKESEIQLGFLCPEHELGHLATISMSDSDQRKWSWRCSLHPASSGYLSEQEEPWLNGFYAATCPQMRDLMDKVAMPIEHKRWKAFAIQLGLNSEIVFSIHQEFKDNVQDCLLAVFHHWMERETSPLSWKTIVNALRSPSLNEFRLAKNISEEFLEGHAV